MITEHIGNGIFILGDCFDRMSELPDGSVDMILADLPYGTTACKWDSVLPLAPLWTEYRRVCRRNAAIVLTAQTPFDKVLGVSNLPDLRYEWVWEKTQPTGHLNAKKAPMKAHENILVFYREQPTYNPIKTAGHARKTAIKRGDITKVYGAQTEADLPYDSTERYPRTVIPFAKDTQRTKIHDTQKPVALFEYLIRTYTNEGDLVLDNTAGSGTTAIAAERAGRKWVCIERDESYFTEAVQRVKDAVPGWDLV